MALTSNIDLAAQMKQVAQSLLKRGACHSQVVGVDAQIEHNLPMGTKALYLHVRHQLWEVDYLDPRYAAGVPYDKIAEKMRAALLIREPSAKSARVERRLMRARGEQARKSKARRI